MAEGVSKGEFVRITNDGPRLGSTRWPNEVIGSTSRSRMRINANQVAAGWAEFLSQYNWQVLVTLTTDPKRVPDASEATVGREAFAWCNNVAWLARRPVGWVYAVEGGGGRHLHAHALLVGTRQASLDAACAAWVARNGKIDVQTVYDPKGVAQYLCKAVGPNGEIVFSDTLNRYPRSVDNVDVRKLKST